MFTKIPKNVRRYCPNCTSAQLYNLLDENDYNKKPVEYYFCRRCNKNIHFLETLSKNNAISLRNYKKKVERYNARWGCFCNECSGEMCGCQCHRISDEETFRKIMVGFVNNIDSSKKKIKQLQTRINKLRNEMDNDIEKVSETIHQRFMEGEE